MDKVKILPITLEAAIEVASNLRSDDFREVVEGHGVNPLEYAYSISQADSCVYFTMPNGKTAGMAGVEKDGLIWMLCTPVIHEFPFAFARGAKGFVESRTEPILHNIVDERNVIHLRLLKFLGFKFFRKIFHGPNNLSFIEFYRVFRTRP